MGASRKLQGEIDRVLKKVQEGVDIFDSIWNKVYDTENVNQKEKFEADLKKEIKKLQRYRDQIKTWIQSSEIKDKKVSASYEQALMDARKQIEREMERFKICEKETKTKAFSKEGLGQQPKTDPKEKAKSETRDWLNNVVGDLESQMENFEAEIEAVSVKKGKARPPRLTHLETSVVRHKAHIMKLELILRLLDNDELSPEQVNDLKDFLEDYVERNQDDFNDFSDVDEFYNALPLEKVESLEDLVSNAPAALKGVGSISTASAVLGGLKGSIASSPTQGLAALSSTSHQTSSLQDPTEEPSSQDGNPDNATKTTPSKSGTVGSMTSSTSNSTVSAAAGPVSAASTSTISCSAIGETTPAAVLTSPVVARGILENSSVAAAASAVNPSSSLKNDDNISFPSRRSSPAPSEFSIGRGTGRGSMTGVLLNQSSISGSMNLGSVGAMSGTGSLSAIPAISDKRNILEADERIETGSISQSLVSPLNNRMLLHQGSKSNDGVSSGDASNVGEGAVGGRAFSPSIGSVQWRPQGLSSFQNQNETGRGRTEITPDIREKYFQRLQQVQQQGPSNLVNSPHLSVTSNKQYPSQQQNSLLQQLNSQSLSAQGGVGFGIQAPSLGIVKSASQLQQQHPVHPPTNFLNGSRDSDPGIVKLEGKQLNSSDDLSGETLPGYGSNKPNEDDLKSAYLASTSASMVESTQLPKDTDLAPGQPLQSNQTSASLGVIGRRSIPDFGAIGDSISGPVGSPGAMHEAHNLQLLEAAYHRLPQPKDSERVKSYTPRHPVTTPASYPQVQAPIVDNPAFWERLGMDSLGTDTLFFAFYYQQNTYQQYLAARELKRQSWRYHRKYHTWFQRHEEPKITTDDYEQGTYVYFDFHFADDNSQNGWCQRIKTEFRFEYSYLEDELVV